MAVLLIICVTFFGYLMAYHTYAKWLVNRCFKLSPNRSTPACDRSDGVDFVPSSKHVVFGHHFTSIAGTGPIVGPAIGVIWGWLPALIWVFLGSIFMGAVHDLSAVVMSLRNDGKSIVDIAGIYLNRRVRYLFFSIVFLGLLIVIAIFGLVIASIFDQFPQSVAAVWIEIPIAIWLGRRLKNHSSSYATWIAKLLMLGAILLGVCIPIEMGSVFGIPVTGVWTIILLIYAFFAAILPVTTLLQPRDYLNAWQLYGVLILLVSAILVTSFTQPIPLSAPPVRLDPLGAPPILPFLFITIACGAISGFHSLVSSGTTSKQISVETDAQFIGFGAMILEGFLAVLVIIVVTAGLSLGYTLEDGTLLTGSTAWFVHYESWMSSAGLGSKLSAVVVGAANFLNGIGVPVLLGTTIMGVFIASFAATTLDTAVRIQRYITAELLENSFLKRAKSPLLSTSIAVISAAALAFSSGADGKGALLLWPLFGAVNQLLAGLALMVASVYISHHHEKWMTVFTAIPCVFLMGMTLWATVFNHFQFLGGAIVLTFINILVGCLAIVIVVETIACLMSRSVNKDLALR